MSSTQSSGGRHPCFDKGAHRHFGRMHLPVAVACNVQCGFCDRQYACVNESRPGVTARLLSPEEALNAVVRTAEAMPNLSVVGIAGPGDPLANIATLSTLRLLQQHVPHLLPCLSTNGLALPEHVDSLVALGVRHVTVTVNAVDPRIGARIYTHVTHNEERLTGKDGAALLLAKQEQGVRRLKEHGVTVKINTVIIPGINDIHAPKVAEQVARWGADIMNCLALLSVAGTPLGKREPPSPALMEHIRAEAGCFLPQMRHCARCRADAVGLLGDSGRLEDQAMDTMPNPCAGGSGRSVFPHSC